MLLLAMAKSKRQTAKSKKKKNIPNFVKGRFIMLQHVLIAALKQLYLLGR